MDDRGLRGLPPVHAVIQGLEGYPPSVAREAARDTLEEARSRVLAGGACPTLEETVAAAADKAVSAVASTMATVVNATGVVLHTALGRACLPAGAVENITRVATGYAVLQWDRQAGGRGHRDSHIESLLTKITGAEAATVANNNAGATLLVLSSLAAGREVVVSRGQLVEIGGAFRIPEVMRQSGCSMVEVGCTNRTHLRDYREALSDRTAAILRVHPSNYRIRGFSGEPSIEELAALGREAGVPVIDDLGAGSLVPLDNFGLPGEPTVGQSIQAGASVVTCSGDKLIGGPQAGLLLGMKVYIDRIRKHPLARALRVCKLTLAGLEATLKLFLEDPDYLAAHHPVYRMFSGKPGEMADRAAALLHRLSLPQGCSASVQEMGSYVGSGALPDTAIPSAGVSLSCPSPDSLALALRSGSPAVAVRVEENAVKMDMRTVLPEQEDILVLRLNREMERLWG
jgi:L-seryl-tRNA(Ser) seleniumtransferase